MVKKDTNVAIEGTWDFFQSIWQIVAEELRSAMQSFNAKKENMIKEFFKTLSYSESLLIP